MARSSALAFQRLLEPPPPVENVRPVVRPRGGQLALVLAAGLFNGIVVQTETGRAAVRSTVEPVEQLVEGGEVDETDETTVEREVYRTRPQVTITLLNEQGQITDMSGDAALVDFIGRHKSALLAYLDEHFSPLYNFDYGELAPILNRVQIKGNRLYETQKHVVAVDLHRLAAAQRGDHRRRTRASAKRCSEQRWRSPYART